MTSKAPLIEPSEHCPRDMIHPSCAAKIGCGTCGAGCSAGATWLRMFEGLALADVVPPEKCQLLQDLEGLPNDR